MARNKTQAVETHFDRTEGGTAKGLCRNLALLLPAALLILGLGAEPAEARCKSFAGERTTAEDYCEGVLQCSKKNPPKIIKCTGRTNDWKCRCVAKPAGGQNNIEGLLRDSDSNTPALLNALAGALNDFNGTQQSAVTTPYVEHNPSALEAARQANRDRERDLIRARALDQQRKHDKKYSQGHHDTTGETGATVDHSAGEAGVASNDNLGAFSNALGRYSGDGGCGITALELLVNGGLILAHANGQVPLSVSGSQASGQNVTLFGVTGHHLAVLFIQGVLELTAQHPGGASCHSRFERL